MKAYTIILNCLTNQMTQKTSWDFWVFTASLPHFYLSWHSKTVLWPQRIDKDFTLHAKSDSKWNNSIWRSSQLTHQTHPPWQITLFKSKQRCLQPRSSTYFWRQTKNLIILLQKDKAAAKNEIRLKGSAIQRVSRDWLKMLLCTSACECFIYWGWSLSRNMDLNPTLPPFAKWGEKSTGEN